MSRKLHMGHLVAIFEELQSDAEIDLAEHADGLFAHTREMESVRLHDPEWSRWELLRKNLIHRVRESMRKVCVMSFGQRILLSYAKATYQPIKRIPLSSVAEVDAFVRGEPAFFDMAEKISFDLHEAVNAPTGFPTHELVLLTRDYIQSMGWKLQHPVQRD